MWAATSTILEDFAADAAVRVVVLTGAGGKAFVPSPGVACNGHTGFLAGGGGE